MKNVPNEDVAFALCILNSWNTDLTKQDHPISRTPSPDLPSPRLIISLLIPLPNEQTYSYEIPTKIPSPQLSIRQPLNALKHPRFMDVPMMSTYPPPLISLYPLRSVQALPESNQFMLDLVIDLLECYERRGVRRVFLCVQRVSSGWGRTRVERTGVSGVVDTVACVGFQWEE